MKSRILRRAGALLLALSLACSLLTLPVSAADIPGLSITADKTELDSGGSTTLRLTGAPTGADIDIEWTSTQAALSLSPRTDKTICDITAGTVTGPDTVEVEVTATVKNGAGDSGSAVCIVTIKPEEPDPVDPPDPIPPAKPDITVKLDKNSASLPIGGSLTLKADVTAPEGTNTTLNWNPSDKSKFRLDVSPYDSHTATITTSSSAKPGDRVTLIAYSQEDPGASDYCVIEVVAAASPQVSSVQITTTPTNDGRNYVDLGAGNEVTLVATVSPAGVSEEDGRITWTSSDTSIARVNPNTGEITGVAPGEATITAEAGGKTDERKIEVSGILLSYVDKSTTGGKGETVRLFEDSVVDIYQYRDLSIVYEVFGNARNKTIGWESSNNSVAQVLAGRVTAHYPGSDVTITATAEGTYCHASFKVRVLEDVAQAILVDMGSEPSYSFSGLLYELDRRSQDKAKGPLDCVYSLKVSTENGVLYYKYTSPETPGHGVGGTERYYYQPTGQGQMALKDVTFIPLPGFDGTAVVNYNAVATNGTTFSGTIRIEATATGDVSYSTAIDQPVSFAAEHFSAVCKGRTGRAIGYVTFGLPSSSRGTLYYNYSPTGQYSPKVNNSTRYYASSSPSIDDITFVPAKGYSGDVDIPYRCTDSSGASYSGTVRIRVYGANGEGTGSVEYSIGRNQRKSLNASDFNSACQRAVNGTLNYIRFNSLPSSSAGTLYLNYRNSSSTKVTTGRNYYRSGTPRISDISFVPASNYSGTVTIPFTGTSSGGTTFSGSLVFHVDDGTGTVHYNTPKGQSVTFGSGEFNDACYSITGRALSRIRLTSLPSSGTGVLYYNYYNASSSRASTGTDYRRSGTPSISSLTFVPAAGYVGTVTIPFTGYDENNTRFNATVTISVGGGSGRSIFYSVPANGFVRFGAADFNSACRSATGDALSYVRFDLPAFQYGSLYYQYNTASRTGGTVSSSTGYYYSNTSPLLGDVGFAASSTAGTATFGYTGYSTRGDSFTGTVEITISGSAAVSSVIRYTGSAAHPIPFRAADFQNACQAALGNQLSYVQFSSLPYSGRLYQNYSGPVRTGTGVSSGTHYGPQQLGQISYLPKAEFQGTLTIPYTAYDTKGGSHSSAVELQISNGYCAATFSDTASGWDWAKPSIEFLRSSGVTNGYSNNTYRPGQSISRGEFTLMICRAFQFSTGGSSGFPDVPAGSTYAGAVAAARDLGIVQGNNGRFQPDRPITRQSAMTMICRAIEAAGQSLPVADAGLLSSYADGSQVSAFARPSVAALVQMGAVRGNSASRLNPGAAISRAEMAVILHRVLTR
ncbi:MAG: hypothetical protein HFF98_07500 [Oscillibacter sp.]|jgi:uncharacterized protein YjdB|nr:hypothetical protein [Oscillibacter sp.]